MSPPATLENLPLRFWPKVQKQDGCWIWTGARTRKGYGRLRRISYVLVYAHRASWEIHRGPIPSGLLVLHRCDNPPCVNPDHLFLGTVADNAHDMVVKGRAYHRQATHCKHGHRFDEANTRRFIRPSDGRPRRACRQCAADWAREAKRRKVAA